LALDIAKGVLAVWIGIWMFPADSWVSVACGLLAIVGHNWPVFFGFRGGKGIATTIGAMATLSPLAFLIAGVAGLLLVVVTRYVSLGSLVFTGLLPIVLWLSDAGLDLIGASCAVFALAVFRHRGNIVK